MDILKKFFGHLALRRKTYLKKRMKTLWDQAQREGLMDHLSREMVENIFNFTETLVREIMVPRTEIAAVCAEGGIDEILDEIIRSPYTRLPVYTDSIDNIVGILNVKDLLKFLSKPIVKADVLSCLSLPYYIPETKSAHMLLYELKDQKQHMAIVIDEYGGTAGLVTLEDLLEEIVGEIRDAEESQNLNQEMVQMSDGSWIVDGRTEIEKIEKCLEISLKQGQYETLGGLILDAIKRIPVTGEKFFIRGLDITIEKADERSIKKVKVKKVISREGHERQSVNRR